jgi:isopentenyl diphosphate isomerase/L-lactate dehydrogenase-like FMN-dependent dehydrogenase
LLRPGYEFIAAGSGEEISESEAIAAWRNFRLRPRVLRDVSSVDTSTAVLCAPLPSPVLIAPTAFQSVAHDDGEVEMARGVSAAGSLLVVPTRALWALAAEGAGGVERVLRGLRSELDHAMALAGVSHRGHRPDADQRLTICACGVAASA